MEDAIILSGSGALENAWWPVKEAIGDFFDTKVSGNRIKITDDLCNTYMAKLVYEARISKLLSDQRDLNPDMAISPQKNLCRFKKILKEKLEVSH